MMNPELKARWLAELRNPATKKGRVFLRKADGSECCLGVLARIEGVHSSVVEHISNGVIEKVCEFDFRGKVCVSMPSKAWALEKEIGPVIMSRLVQLNDDKDNDTFEEVIQYIEVNL